MCVQSTRAFKDFLPLFATVITIIAGYYYLTVQAKKNRRGKWIDEFRIEIANFSSIATAIAISTDL